MDETPKKRSKWVWLLLLAVAIVAVVLWQTGNLGAVSGKTDTYQAVFLTNNQVYFGKISNTADQYVQLNDVYYLQVTQTLQPPQQNAQPITGLNLIKLGGEIHGPADPMYINRDQVLFWENLKPDSQVVKAIEQFKQSQGK